MIEIGNWLVVPSVWFWISLATIGGSIMAAIIARVALRVRTSGTRMAVRQAELDYPGIRGLQAAIVEKSPRKIVQVDLATGKSVRYQIAIEEELAIRIDH